MDFYTIALGILILFLGGVAIFMVRTFRQSEHAFFPPGRETPQIDIEDLVLRVAKAVAQEVGKEVREALRENPVMVAPVPGTLHYPNGVPPGGVVDAAGNVIQMDESVIPVNLSVNAQEANLEGMAKEEVAVDKDLSKSKSKLASILKKKG